MRHLLGVDLVRISLTDLMVAIGVSRVKDRSELHLAQEFGLGGTRWHGVGLILDDVRWHKI
jgi:hypothetical protein